MAGYDPLRRMMGGPREVARTGLYRGGEGMAAQTGKRYTCPKCGSEFIVTKGGDGDIMCGETPLELKK